MPQTLVASGVCRGMWLVVCLCAMAVPLHAAEPSGFVTKSYTDATGLHKYSLFIPRGYTPQKKWPAVLFLHGAGERGNDGELPTKYGLGPAIRARGETFPFFAIFPQVEDLKGRILTAWSPEGPDGKRALKILEQVEREYSVDPGRVALSGWSMGGYGAFQVAAAHPRRFAGLLTLSAGADPQLAPALKDLPTWVFHGTKDNVVRVDESRKIVNALRSAGSRAWYTELPRGDHNIWETVYTEDAVLNWLAQPSNTGTPPVLLRSNRRQGATVAVPPEPFVPSLDIPNALYVRLGNEMLAAVADSVPKSISPDVLTGTLNDISDYTSSSGHSFNVNFSNLSYSAQLARATVKAYGEDRLNVQLAVSNLQIVIGNTYVNGGRRSAVTGPIYITIGHMRPVWISFDVVPYVENRKLKLRFLGSRFEIPDDNWYVSPPMGVETQGLFMTEQRVTDGLVSGLYGAKYRIEEQVTSVIPSLVVQVEKQLDLSQADKAVANLWPLPVYQPRMRTWPDQVRTDDKGVSISLGVTVAAFDPKIQNKWRIIRPVAPGVSAIPRVTRFQFGIAPEILGPLSQMLQEIDVARIHVLDTPSKPLSRLVDAAVMREVIPDLARYGDKVELWSEIALTAPLKVADGSPPAVRIQEAGVLADPAATGQPSGTGKPSAPVESNSGPAKQFTLIIPRLTLHVGYKTDPASNKFQPLAEFDFDIRQNAWPQLESPSFLVRSLSLMLDEQFQLKAKGRFASGYVPQNTTLNTARLEEVFRAGWREFTHGGPTAATPLPDINLNYCKLRATNVEWADPFVATTFGPAGVKLTNSSQEPLVYETKGPYSDWSNPFTLKPGMTHEFDIASPLIFRRTTDTGYEMFTLPAGSHSEFFVAGSSRRPQLYQARPRPTVAPPVPPEDLSRPNSGPPRQPHKAAALGIMWR